LVTPALLSFVLASQVLEFGGPCRDRTYDQLIKSQLLYQLS
jgi:hypothetical protein